MRNGIIVHILCLPGFVLTPTSVNAILGTTATFNCRATTGQCAWLVNGSLLSDLNTPDITTSSIGNTFFLHVPATEEYNNTNVTCVAPILGGDDQYSGPVVLRVQGMFVYIIKTYKFNTQFLEIIAKLTRHMTSIIAMQQNW